MIPERLRGIIYTVVVNLALTSGSLLVLLSFMYGQFPPPMGKIQAQFKEIQNASGKDDFIERKSQEKPRVAVLAEAAANNGEENLVPDPRLLQGQKPRERDKNNIVVRQETVRLQASNNPTDPMAEVRQLRFKVQTLEARQMEMKQWMDSVRANARNSAKAAKKQ